MAQKLITYAEALLAFRQLKSSVYFDSSFLRSRIDVARYERGNLAKKLRIFVGNLSKPKSRSLAIKRWLSEISAIAFPKKLKSDEGDVYTNRNLTDVNEAERLSCFIKCPIEVHLLAVIWANRVGSKIDGNFPESCQGNRLKRTRRSGRFSDQSLFRFYPVDYMNWRDGALRTAKKVHDEGQDATILNLDIRDFYHSVDSRNLDVSSAIHSSDQWLHDLIIEIGLAYADSLKENGVKSTKCPLPIGLLSSPILANLALSAFDNEVGKWENVAYYGRYVDDILIVLKGSRIGGKDRESLEIGEIIKTELSERINGSDGIHLREKPRKSWRLTLFGQRLHFQEEKVKAFFFDRRDTPDLLYSFIREVRKGSSEFRHLPETNELFSSLHKGLFRVSYNDTINKLRSIKDVSVDKYSVSVRLTKIIRMLATTDVEHEDRRAISARLLGYFSGRRALQLYDLWEKAFTYFSAANDLDGLRKLAEQFADAILSLKGKTKRATNLLRRTLLDHLCSAASLAIAINLPISKKEWSDIKVDRPQGRMERLIKNIPAAALQRAKLFLNANLVRHHHLPFPMLAYEGFSSELSLLRPDVQKAQFLLSDKALRLSPRKVNHHDVFLYSVIRRLATGDGIRKREHSEIISKINGIPENKVRISVVRKSGKVIVESSGKTDLKIALVNFPVDFKNSLASMRGAPVLDKDRRSTIHGLLNAARANKCDFIVFPEISVPFLWIPDLVRFSQDSRIAVICGLEHVTNHKKEVYNLACTVLPTAHRQVVVDFRNKDNYSPREESVILSEGLKVGPPSKRMPIYDWRGTRFVTFNCFELSDIEKRSPLRGHVDLVFAIEYNKDTEYFSSIVESSVRDIHCYVAQVNAPNFGDSRITQPSSSELRDLVKIKGGENAAILIGSIAISELRTWQSLSPKNQLSITENAKKNGSPKPRFKQVPPGFTMGSGRII